MKVILSGLSCLLLGCAGGAAPNHVVVIHDASVSHLLATADAHWEQSREALLLADGNLVTDCEGYARSVAGNPPAEDSVHRHRAADYLDCDLIALLDGATAGEPTVASETSRGEWLSTYLDLSAIDHSLGPRWPASAQTLSQAFPDTVETTPLGVSLHEDDWLYALTVLAEADLTGDGQTDWLVHLTDRSLDGTYFDTQLWVVSPRSGLTRPEPVSGVPRR